MIYHVTHERLVYPELGIPGNDLIVQRAMPKIIRALEVMEKELSDGRPFLIGDEVTLADNTGMACLRRCDTTASSVMAPITAARNTLADGCTTMTKATSASAASPTASLGPNNAAVIKTVPQTMVTLAPDTAVKCVKPATRNSSVVCAVNVDVSPSTSAGSIAA